ncbi:MAG: UPF0489 family protein, partial [Candidatus Omnitrophica bacterium]|nr:UPF0489 family protein [Candidatus Omnitrophota bacterium]
VRLWRQSGNFWLAWADLFRDLKIAFPFYVNLITNFSYGVRLASSEVFEFLRSVKEAFVEGMDPDGKKRSNNITRFEETALYKGGKMISEGLPVKGLVGMAGIVGFLVAFFTMDLAGAILLLPYLYASIVMLTGIDVLATFTKKGDKGRQDIYGTRVSKVFSMLPLRISQTLDYTYRVIDRLFIRYTKWSPYMAGFRMQAAKTRGTVNYKNNAKVFVGVVGLNIAVLIAINLPFLAMVPLMIGMNAVLVTLATIYGGYVSGVKHTRKTVQVHTTPSGIKDEISVTRGKVNQTIQLDGEDVRALDDNGMISLPRSQAREMVAKFDEARRKVDGAGRQMNRTQREQMIFDVSRNTKGFNFGKEIDKLQLTHEGQFAANILSSSDWDVAQFGLKPVRDIVIAGNDDISTFVRALEMIEFQEAERIVITGGYGRLTLPLIQSAVNVGIPVKVSDNRTISTDAELDALKAEVKAGNREGIITVSEANIILQIMRGIVRGEGQFRHAANRPGLISNIYLEEGFDVILEEKSTNTRDNFANYRLNLAAEGRLNGDESYRFAYIQKPIQQFRTKATVEAVFADLIGTDAVTAISHTVEYDISVGIDTVRRDVINEVFRLALYTVKGDITPVADGKSGLKAVPAELWKVATRMFKQLAEDEQQELAQSFKTNIASTNVSENDLIEAIENEIKTFVQTVLKPAQPTAADMIEAKIALTLEVLEGRAELVTAEHTVEDSEWTAATAMFRDLSADKRAEITAKAAELIAVDTAAWAERLPQTAVAFLELVLDVRTRGDDSNNGADETTADVSGQQSEEQEAAEITIRRATVIEDSEELRGLRGGYIYPDVDRIITGGNNAELAHTALEVAGIEKSRKLRVVDLGTGYGYYLIQLADLFTQIGQSVGALHGIDNDTASEAVREEFARTHPQLPLSYQTVSVTEYTADEKFDMVTINSPISSLIRPMLEKAVDSLRDRGIIWISFELGNEEEGYAVFGMRAMREIAEERGLKAEITRIPSGLSTLNGRVAQLEDNLNYMSTDKGDLYQIQVTGIVENGGDQIDTTENAETRVLESEDQIVQASQAKPTSAAVTGVDYTGADKWIFEGTIEDVQVEAYRYPKNAPAEQQQVEYTGVQNKVIMTLSDGRKVMVTDDHNHAYSFWWLMKQMGVVPANDNKLLHIDAHADAVIPRRYDAATDPFFIEQAKFAAIDAYSSRVLGIEGFISPLAMSGFFSEWSFLYNLEDYNTNALMVPASKYAYRIDEGGYLHPTEFKYNMLDIDIDVFNGMTAEVVEAHLDRFAEMADGINAISIATSPSFIDQVDSVTWAKRLIQKMEARSKQADTAAQTEAVTVDTTVTPEAPVQNMIIPVITPLIQTLPTWLLGGLSSLKTRVVSALYRTAKAETVETDSVVPGRSSTRLTSADRAAQPARDSKSDSREEGFVTIPVLLTLTGVAAAGILTVAYPVAAVIIAAGFVTAVILSLLAKSITRRGPPSLRSALASIATIVRENRTVLLIGGLVLGAIAAATQGQAETGTVLAMAGTILPGSDEEADKQLREFFKATIANARKFFTTLKTRVLKLPVEVDRITRMVKAQPVTVEIGSRLNAGDVEFADEFNRFFALLRNKATAIELYVFNLVDEDLSGAIEISSPDRVFAGLEALRYTVIKVEGQDSRVELKDAAGKVVAVLPVVEGRLVLNLSDLYKTGNADIDAFFAKSAKTVVTVGEQSENGRLLAKAGIVAGATAKVLSKFKTIRLAKILDNTAAADLLKFESTYFDGQLTRTIVKLAEKNPALLEALAARTQSAVLQRIFDRLGYEAMTLFRGPNGPQVYGLAEFLRDRAVAAAEATALDAKMLKALETLVAGRILIELLPENRTTQTADAASKDADAEAEEPAVTEAEDKTASQPVIYRPQGGTIGTAELLIVANDIVNRDNASARLLAVYVYGSSLTAENPTDLDMIIITDSDTEERTIAAGKYEAAYVGSVDYRIINRAKAVSVTADDTDMVEELTFNLSVLDVNSVKVFEFEFGALESIWQVLEAKVASKTVLLSRFARKVLEFSKTTLGTVETLQSYGASAGNMVTDVIYLAAKNTFSAAMIVRHLIDTLKMTETFKSRDEILGFKAEAMANNVTVEEINALNTQADVILTAVEAGSRRGSNQAKPFSSEDGFITVEGALVLTGLAVAAIAAIHFPVPTAVAVAGFAVAAILALLAKTIRRRGPPAGSIMSKVTSLIRRILPVAVFAVLLLTPQAAMAQDSVSVTGVIHTVIDFVLQNLAHIVVAGFVGMTLMMIYSYAVNIIRAMRLVQEDRKQQREMDAFKAPTIDAADKDERQEKLIKAKRDEYAKVRADRIQSGDRTDRLSAGIAVAVFTVLFAGIVLIFGLNPVMLLMTTPLFIFVLLIGAQEVEPLKSLIEQHDKVVVRRALRKYDVFVYDGPQTPVTAEDKERQELAQIQEIIEELREVVGVQELTSRFVELVEELKKFKRVSVFSGLHTIASVERQRPNGYAAEMMSNVRNYGGYGVVLQIEHADRNRTISISHSSPLLASVMVEDRQENTQARHKFLLSEGKQASTVMMSGSEVHADKTTADFDPSVQYVTGFYVSLTHMKDRGGLGRTLMSIVGSLAAMVGSWAAVLHGLFRTFANEVKSSSTASRQLVRSAILFVGAVIMIGPIAGIAKAQPAGTSTVATVVADWAGQVWAFSMVNINLILIALAAGITVAVIANVVMERAKMNRMIEEDIKIAREMERFRPEGTQDDELIQGAIGRYEDLRNDRRRRNAVDQLTIILPFMTASTIGVLLLPFAATLGLNVVFLSIFALPTFIMFGLFLLTYLKPVERVIKNIEEKRVKRSLRRIEYAGLQNEEDEQKLADSMAFMAKIERM